MATTTNALNITDLKKGMIVRSMDFEPMEGRRDRFIEGIIRDLDHDQEFVEIEVIYDTEKSRRLHLARFPFPGVLYFCEYPARVQILSGV